MGGLARKLASVRPHRRWGAGQLGRGVSWARSPPADPCHLPQYVDLRTRYSELTTLTSQYIKFITETLRRLEEEEVGERHAGTWGGMTPAAFSLLHNNGEHGS